MSNKKQLNNNFIRKIREQLLEDVLNTSDPILHSTILFEYWMKQSGYTTYNDRSSSPNSENTFNPGNSKGKKCNPNYGF